MLYHLGLATSYFLSGFLMKYSDDEYDEKNNTVKAIILGIFCGLFAAIATVSNIDAAYIFIAILLGNLLALKVDGIHHLFTLAVFIIFCFICGIPSISIPVLIIIMISALLDEVGHEHLRLNKFLDVFFEYRFVMKITVLLLAIFSILDIWTFVFFILFEIAYELAGYIFKQLN